MSTGGVIRYITNLGTVLDEKRSQYQVLTTKSYELSPGINKVEAVLSMTEEMGLRLVTHNGMEIENIHVEISRMRKCRDGNKCPKIEKDCPFYHQKSAELKTGGLDNHDKVRGKKQVCWYWSSKHSCPFGTKCMFLHSSNSTPTDEPHALANTEGLKEKN